MRERLKQDQMWGMTEAPATPSAPESHRLDDSDPPWPQRPWIMAIIGAVAGLIFHQFVDTRYSDHFDRWNSAMAAFVAVSTVVFLLGVELRRWHWAAGFALLWGAVIGLIAFTSSTYNIGGSPFEWPFWSGMLAVLVATPLFQTRRDVAPDARFWKLWQMPYERLHSHAWTDAVIGAAGLAFTGLTFLLVILIGQMFKLVGIDVIERLLQGEWFGWMLAGAAFGGAVGLLRERDKLVSTLQRLVMIVLAVLAPVLAVALVLFLLSLMGTGLQKLWDSGFSTAALMMASAAFAVLLANAVIGNGRDDRSANRLMHGAAGVLVVAVLLLAIIAFYSMHLRVIQYGWTPERLWGAIAAMVALAYGAIGLWAAVKGRWGFDDVLRPLQQKLAIGLMLLALFLALPIMDFGAISTRDQLGRLKNGTTKAERFDWAAMAFDFGPDGRKALAQIAKSPDKAKAGFAKWALAAKNRWDLTVGGDKVDAADAAFAAKTIEEKVRVLPDGGTLEPALYASLRDKSWCWTNECIAYRVAADRVAIIQPDGRDVTMLVKDAKTGSWESDYPWNRQEQFKLTDGEMRKARIEMREVSRKQLFVNGKPMGQVFE